MYIITITTYVEYLGVELHLPTFFLFYTDSYNNEKRKKT